MARARQAGTPTPGQLTLEDWAETLKARPTSLEASPCEPANVNPAGAGASAEIGERLRSVCADAAAAGAVRHHPLATELLDKPAALLTRTHLRELGLERRAVDAVFRTLAVVALPGYSRPMIRVRDYLELLEHSTFRDDRVRPMVSTRG
jgi:hypothetical protein